MIKVLEYDDDFIKIANSTSRQGGATSMLDGIPKSACLKYLMQNRDEFSNKSVLDFGAGKLALQTKYLLSNGFNDVTAYDFGANCNDGIHDPYALSRKYDVIMVSNVLNVSSSRDMLMETLEDISRACMTGTIIICNYPNSPRKWLISGKPATSKEVRSVIEDILGDRITLVAGTNSAPVWKIIVS